MVPNGGTYSAVSLHRYLPIGKPVEISFPTATPASSPSSDTGWYVPHDECNYPDAWNAVGVAVLQLMWGVRPPFWIWIGKKPCSLEYRVGRLALPDEMRDFSLAGVNRAITPVRFKSGWRWSHHRFPFAAASPVYAGTGCANDTLNACRS
ncbi:hypothetical protein CROQUDRAFT_101136 [Cronartium quercuum f. sp. fusiforme G11]|uniref:Uncharacterized protein n=1 Tax=Cronartium quercuum f. sp. fusiforme G11 TaxID=708437 RepID=A0A9P6T5I2_9BASI|nr:hypothetical protein CROQUDRAFT_101136 [Cronartium quercuum f. sp. fusiforme G11]